LRRGHSIEEIPFHQPKTPEAQPKGLSKFSSPAAPTDCDRISLQNPKNPGSNLRKRRQPAPSSRLDRVVFAITKAPSALLRLPHIPSHLRAQTAQRRQPAPAARAGHRWFPAVGVGIASRRFVPPAPLSLLNRGLTRPTRAGACFFLDPGIRSAPEPALLDRFAGLWRSATAQLRRD
jgi:hypothetical protein